MVSGPVERERRHRLTPVAILILVAVVLVSLHARFEDPMSSPVMATEDPYTHLVFTREHMDRGYFDDSYHMGTGLYPPGLHAMLGIFWGTSQVDLYGFMLYGAPLWGALAAAGMFLLAHRFGGLAAGGTAGFATALFPEHIIRTNVFFPVAMDLAIIPFLLIAFIEAADGNRMWLIPGGLLGLTLTFAHPWVVPLMLLPVIAYLAVTAVLRWWREGTSRPWADTGIAAATAAALAVVALQTRWRQSSSGFGDFVASADPGLLWGFLGAVLNPVVLGVLVVGAAALAVLVRKGYVRTARGIATAGVALVLSVLIPTFTYSPPLFVDYQYQLGWLAMSLAVAGVIAYPLWLRNRLTLIGTALAAVTFPLTAVNVFQSQYLPHRTVVFLSVAVALLAAGFVAFLARAVDRLATTRGPQFLTTSPSAGMGMRMGTALAVTALLAAALAGPGTAEPESWYRYHEEDEFPAYKEMQRILEEQPRAVAITGDWRPNMMLKALSPDLDDVWFVKDYFRDPAYREQLNWDAASSMKPVYVFLDRYSEQENEDVSWLHDGAYTPVWECECGTITIYKWERDGA